MSTSFAPTLITELGEASGDLPLVLVTEAKGEAERRAALRALVARVLLVTPGDVLIEHQPLRRPSIAAPLGSGLFLSSASRDGVAALAVARAPVGVDIEVATEQVEIPWNVLHADERAALAAAPRCEQGRAFLKLWTAKEAYYKALQSDFTRDPTTFAVSIEGETASVRDPSFSGLVDVLIRRLAIDGRDTIVAAALLIS